MKQLKEQIGLLALTIGFICLASDTEINTTFWLIKVIGIVLFIGGAKLAGWLNKVHKRA